MTSPKTKELSLKLKEIGFEKGLIIYKELSDNMRLASRNIANLEVCLLYTSPSPRDKRQSRMPSSA